MPTSEKPDTTRRRMLQGVPLLAAGMAATAVPAAESRRAPAGAWATRKKRARINGLNMAYIDEGRGDPVVFLHGNPTSSYLWRNVIPHVVPHGRCIAPDLVGMGDSDPLPDSGPGRYTFETHREFLFGLLDHLNLGNRITFVVHDWGSGLGFHWAQQHPSRVKGLAYMEAIVRPPDQPMPAATVGPFVTFRSAAGEEAVLGRNIFVEDLLIRGLGDYLSEEDKAEYRRPYRVPGESRRPTLEWPRELPLGGEPHRTDQLVLDYSTWLAADESIPKLFVHALPGAILADPMRLAFVRGFKRQTEVTVYGPHYVQEVSPHAIGRALARWIPSLS